MNPDVRRGEVAGADRRVGGRIVAGARDAKDAETDEHHAGHHPQRPAARNPRCRPVRTMRPVTAPGGIATARPVMTPARSDDMPKR